MLRRLLARYSNERPSYLPSWREALLCLSLASLYLHKAWERVLKVQDLSFELGPPTYKPLCAIVCCVLALAAVFWVVGLIGRKLPRRFSGSAGRMLFPLIVAVPFLAAAKLDNHDAIRIILGLATVVVALGWTETAARCARAVAMLTLPLLPIQCLYAIKTTAGRSIAHNYLRQAQPQPGPVRPRIVWLIFDELDQTLSFTNRPADVRMPEFDRLRRESFYATDAEPPAIWTNRSIPALTTGRMVADARTREDADLDLVFTDSPAPHRWKAQSSIFQSARQLGRNTGLAGWYLPYCSVFGDHLDSCYTALDADATPSLRKVEYDRTLPFFKVMLNDLREEYVSLPFPEMALHGLLSEEYTFVRRQHEEAYLNIRERALSLASDPNYGLVLIHWPIPHPLGIYHRIERGPASGNQAGYLDNLELADETLGILRRTMEAAGTWDDSIVLVTGDHGFRPFLWSGLPGWNADDARSGALVVKNRVPFLLKIPHHEGGAVYTDHFNTVLTRELFMAMLTGQVQDERDVSKWIRTWTCARGFDKGAT